MTGRSVALAVGFALFGFGFDQKPDLSGHWTQDAAPIPMKGYIPICGAGCTVTQTPDALSVADGMHTNVYTLDGKPQRMIATTDTLRADITMTSVWDTSTLVITRTTVSEQLNSGRPIVVTARLSLTKDRLTIEGVRGNNDGTSDKYAVVYRRAQER